MRQYFDSFSRLEWVSGVHAADFLTAGFVFCGIVALAYLVRRYLLTRLARLAAQTATKVDEIILRLLGDISMGFFVLLAALLAILRLPLAPPIIQLASASLLILLIVRLALFFQNLARALLTSWGKMHDKSTAMQGVSILTGVLIWGSAVLMILSNLGFNITTLAASLGIGGIAVAFALQNILRDIFSSFSIYFDRPFQIGDFIVVGEHAGTVQKIGIKTTRIALLRGEELVIANAELTNLRIQNFKKMTRRRVTQRFGVVYGTSAATLKKIPRIIESVIKKTRGASFDRAHFAGFGASSLDFECVYFAETGEYAAFMDIQQEINLGIVETFEKNNVEMAFPTQTIFMKK